MLLPRNPYKPHLQDFVSDVSGYLPLHNCMSGDEIIYILPIQHLLRNTMGPKKTLRKNCQPVSNPKRIIEHWWFLVLSPFNNGSLHYNLHARRCIALFPAVLFAFGQQGIQFLESHLLSDRGWRARRSKMKQEHQVFQSDLSQKVKGELQFWN